MRSPDGRTGLPVQAHDLWFIVLNYNGLEDTRKCLDSLAAVRHSATVLVVDNASSQDPAGVIGEHYPWVRFQRNRANEGYAGGNNRGIETAMQAGATLVVLLNNDTVVAPQIAHRLLTAAIAYPEHGIIGPVIAYIEEPDTVRTDGVLFNRPDSAGFFHRLEVPQAIEDPPRVVDVDIVNGCCMMLRTGMIREIGLIDERFFLVHEESDYCLRALEAGFRCGVLSEVLVWHKGSSSFKREGNGLQRYFDVRNLSLLLRKHKAGMAGWRSRSASRLEYLKYAYYVYSLECERGTPKSAAAVVEGLYDGLTRTFGPPRLRRRWLRSALQFVLEAKRRVPLANPR